MAVGSFWFWLGAKHSKPRKIYHPDVTEILEKKKKFHADYDESINKFFEGHPNVRSWGGSSLDSSLVTVKGKGGFFTESGHFILDENGEIERWESDRPGISLKRAGLTLSEEMLVAQIKGLLTDNEDASRYCEQVASTLLDDGSCVFNVPFGLHMKEKDYTERYHSEEWEKAWENALMGEFHTKDVCRDEKAGIGCFRLQAI